MRCRNHLPYPVRGWDMYAKVGTGEATYALAERDGPNLLRYMYIMQHHFRRSVCTSHMLFSVGTVVVMDGDMGVEMGAVVAVATSREVECMSTQERNRNGFARVRECMQMRAYREATAEEVKFYNGALAELELSTLTFVKELSQSCCGFRTCRLDYMKFLACEFQADAQKLYVYYMARNPVRFLELATYLNQIFRCRIWIHEVNQADLAHLSHMTTLPPNDTGAVRTS